MCVLIAWYVYADPSISVSISGDVDEAKAFRSSSSHEQSGKTTALTYILNTYVIPVCVLLSVSSYNYYFLLFAVR